MLDLLTLNWVMSAHMDSDQQMSHRMHYSPKLYGKILSTFYRFKWMNRTGFVVVRYNNEWFAYLVDDGVPQV